MMTILRTRLPPAEFASMEAQAVMMTILRTLKFRSRTPAATLADTLADTLRDHRNAPAVSGRIIADG